MRPEVLGVVSVDALPFESIAEVLREGLLDEPVFTVDVGDHGCLELARPLEHWVARLSGPRELRDLGRSRERETH